MSVRCLNKQLPYIQSMIKAVGSEVLTSKALSEFADEYNPTIPEVLAIVAKMKQSLTNEQLDKRFTSFLQEHGIQIERSRLGEGVRGQVDFMHKLVRLSNGENVGETFIEEGSHVLVELLRQNGSPLYQSMYQDITKYPVYQEVVREYGNVYKDIYGEDKYVSKEQQLKDEAIGKLISQIYQNRINGSEPQIIRATSWWGKVREWLSNLLPVTTNQFADAFNLTVDEFIKGGFKKLRPFKTSDVSMYSLEPTKGFDWQNVMAKILDTKSRMTKKQDKDEKGNNKEYYFFDGRKVKNRVTEQVKSIDDSKFSEEELAVNDMKAALGTDLHADIENIVNRYTEKQNGTKPENMTPKTQGVNAQVYASLEKFMHNLLDSDLFDGAEILTEVKLHDPNKDMGGTVDLIILDRNGKAHIFDWKFVTSNGKDGKKKRNLVSSAKKQQWKAQLALYRDILQKQYGVKTFGQTRMIPFGVEYEEGTGNFKSIEVDSDKYLDNVVPSDEETTGNTNLDKLIQQLKNQYKELREKSKFTDENAQIRLKSLQKAIDELRTKQNMSGFVNNAKFEIDELNGILDQESVTDADIRNIISKLDFYRNLTFVLNLDTTGKLSDIIKKAIELESKFYGDATKSGKLAIWKATNKVSYDKMQTVGAMYNFSTLQQINNPVFQLLSRKTTDALNHKENRMRELKGKLIELKSKLTNGYDRLLAKDDKNKYTGTLIQQYDKGFYDELTSADAKWLTDNVQIRETIIVDGKEVKAKDHFEEQLKETERYYRTAIPQDADKLLENYRKKYDVWSDVYKPHALKKFQERRNHIYAEPSSKWHSKEYKWLKDNPDSAESQMYDIFQRIILDGRDVADTGIAKNYIPSRKKSVLNRAMALDGEGIKDAMIDSITMEDYIINMDNDKSLKLVLAKELGEDKDLDLASVYLGFADRVYHSKYMKDVEDIAYIGKAVLQNGKYVKTNKFGNPVRSNGVIETVDIHDADYTVQRTIKAYDEFTDAIIYSTDDGKDIKLGTIGGKAISGKKTLNALLECNAITALGGNVLSGSASIIGAMFNQVFLRLGDNYYNKGTFKDAYGEVASSIFNSDSKAMKVMTLFDINSTSNVTKWEKQVAIDPANKVSKDIAFFIQQGGDHVTQNAGLIAFLKSSTINERGRVVKKTEPDQENIYDRFVLNGDNVTNPLSIEQVNYIRNKVREINTEVTGSLSDRDKLLIKQTTFGRAFTQFKTFAIPMGKVRVGQLYYNANMDEYKEGRFRVASAMVFNDMFKPRENIKSLMSLNMEAIKSNLKAGLRSRYDELIELNPNFDPDLNPDTGLTFEMYVDMTKRNIRTALVELSVAASTMALMILASYYDDDEDEGSATQKFLAENLFRISRELTFWFNPDSLMDFASDTPLPVIGLVSRAGGFINDAFMEGFGLVYGDDGILETAKPVKKGISILPFGKLMNQVINVTSDK